MDVEKTIQFLLEQQAQFAAQQQQLAVQQQQLTAQQQQLAVQQQQLREDLRDRKSVV